MERWTRTPEGTLNVLRTFEETHAISAISNSTPGKALKKKNDKDTDKNVYTPYRFLFC